MSINSQRETFAFRLNNTYDNEKSMFSKFRSDINNLEQLVQNINDFAKTSTLNIINTFNQNIQQYSKGNFNLDNEFKDNKFDSLVFSDALRNYISKSFAGRDSNPINPAKREAIKSFHSLTYLYSTAKVANELLNKYQEEAKQEFEKLNLKDQEKQTQTQLNEVNHQYEQLKKDCFQDLSMDQKTNAKLYIKLVALLELYPDEYKINIDPLENPQEYINQIKQKFGTEQQTNESPTV